MGEFLNLGCESSGIMTMGMELELQLYWNENGIGPSKVACEINPRTFQYRRKLREKLHPTQ